MVTVEFADNDRMLFQIIQMYRAHLKEMFKSPTHTEGGKR